MPPTTGWSPPDYRAGDVLVFHCLPVHAALPNCTNRMRLSGDCRWQAASIPLPRYALYPHHFPHGPGWELLSAGWTMPRWVAPPGDVTLTDIRPYETAGPVPRSSFVDVPDGARPGPGRRRFRSPGGS